MATRRIARNHKEMPGMTVKGTTNIAAKCEYESESNTESFMQFQWLWKDLMTANTASLWSQRGFK